MKMDAEQAHRLTISLLKTGFGPRHASNEAALKTTLWGREFPRGFHYSGYAHEGAAWLTLALAMATAGLSLVFAGRTLADPRLAVLRRWGNVWAIQNLLLAVAVYHRLHIYIGFNGMTRMRTVGIFGISCVVAGFEPESVDTPTVVAGFGGHSLGRRIERLLGRRGRASLALQARALCRDLVLVLPDQILVSPVLRFGAQHLRSPMVGDNLLGQVYIPAVACLGTVLILSRTVG